jgi:hypothetical protein
MTAAALLLSEWPLLAGAYCALLVTSLFLGLRQQQARKELVSK